MRSLALITTLVAACASSKPATKIAASNRTPGVVTAAVEGGRFTIVVQHGDKVFGLVDEPAEEDRFDQVTAVQDAVDGTNGRVVIAQMFQEAGEDEFSRAISLWVVDAATSEILWRGKGSFSNYIDECVKTDVPWARLEGNVLVVEREEEASEGCDQPKSLTKTEITRVTLK